MLSSQTRWSWDELIAEFRALGGRIDNIRLETGSRGPGLFAIDNTKPVLLSLPDNLLFPVDAIDFAGDHIRLKDTTSVGQAERDFFERYEESFSGTAERACSTGFVAALDALPGPLRDQLIFDFGMAELFEGDAADRATRHFVERRQVGWNGKGMIAPVIELANRGMEGLGYEIGDDLAVQGMVRNEVLVSHGVQDALSLFFNHGRAVRAAGAFGLPMKANVRPYQLVVDADVERSAQRGNYRVPELTLDKSRISLSHLMLGHGHFPSAARGIFRALMTEFLGENTDEVFDTIRHFNRNKFLHLLAALESHNGPMITELGKMARFQLEAISWSIGSADLYKSPSPWHETEAALRTSGAAPPAGWTWHEMLEAFRALGGVAENIRLAYGTSGRGIFAVHQDRPVRLHVPENLVFAVSDVTFVGGGIALRTGAAIGASEREFFVRYQEAFSWGGGGRARSAGLNDGIDALPLQVRELLAAEFGMVELRQSDPDIRAQEQFLKSKAIEWQGRKVLVPILELIEHRHDAAPIGTADSLGLETEGTGEIFVSWGAADPFESFRRFGSASAEPGAFSLPTKTKIGEFELIIERKPQAAPGTLVMPQLRRDQDRFVLPFLPLGHPAFPKMSRAIFRTLMRQAAGVDVRESDEAFDRILHFNRLKFIRLLDALAAEDGKAVLVLRQMARHQLEAMSWCVGSRDI